MLKKKSILNISKQTHKKTAQAERSKSKDVLFILAMLHHTFTQPWNPEPRVDKHPFTKECLPSYIYLSAYTLHRVKMNHAYKICCKKHILSEIYPEYIINWALHSIQSRTMYVKTTTYTKYFSFFYFSCSASNVKHVHQYHRGRFVSFCSLW